MYVLIFIFTTLAHTMLDRCTHDDTLPISKRNVQGSTDPSFARDALVRSR